MSPSYGALMSSSNGTVASPLNGNKLSSSNVPFIAFEGLIKNSTTTCCRTILARKTKINYQNKGYPPCPRSGDEFILGLRLCAICFVSQTCGERYQHPVFGTAASPFKFILRGSFSKTTTATRCRKFVALSACLLTKPKGTRPCATPEHGFILGLGTDRLFLIVRDDKDGTNTPKLVSQQPK